MELSGEVKKMGYKFGSNQLKMQRIYMIAESWRTGHLTARKALENIKRGL